MATLMMLLQLKQTPSVKLSTVLKTYWLVFFTSYDKLAVRLYSLTMRNACIAATHPLVFNFNAMLIKIDR